MIAVAACAAACGRVEGGDGEPSTSPSAAVCDAPSCPPSCRHLPQTCGTGEDCCASPLVSGGRFFRSNNPLYPATVSDFRLEKYSVTVGRFAKFVAGYDAWRSGGAPQSGEGTNPRVPGTGWQPEWLRYLPEDAAALRARTHCQGTSGQTWTDDPNTHSTQPINCVNWFTAFAFCLWDGGRLPTEAEWNYAAAGGDEQRIYPWGNVEPGPDATLAIYSCYYHGGGLLNCSAFYNEEIAPVGSAPLGNSRYGQSDLAGQLSEWMFDGYSDPYGIVDCLDCSALSPTDERVTRGGGFSVEAVVLQTSKRWGQPAKAEGPFVGLRCARESK